MFCKKTHLSLFGFQQIVTNDEFPPLTDDDDSVVMPLPKMSITVASQDILQMTVSKQCLQVLTNLGKVRLHVHDVSVLLL